MNGLHIRFTEQELLALRALAGAEGVSVESFAHTAVIRCVNERAQLFQAAADYVGQASAGLNGRLA